MIRPNYRDFRISNLRHSAKGSTWEEHKYIKRVNGTYYYPDSYEGGRHLPNGEKDESNPAEIDKLSSEDIESLANEVIRGNFGNGQERKDLLGDFYQTIQNRVNELLSSSAGSKPISSEVTTETVQKVETAAKNASSKDSKVNSGVDMRKVLTVYTRKRDK